MGGDAGNLTRAWFLEFWNERKPDVARLKADESSRFHNTDAAAGTIKGGRKLHGVLQSVAEGVSRRTFRG